MSISLAAPPSKAETLRLLLDSSKPLQQRARLFFQIVSSLKFDAAQVEEFAAGLIEVAQQAAPAADVAALKEQLQQQLAALNEGPPRMATYLGPAEVMLPGDHPRVHVMTSDGVERFPLLGDKVRLQDLTPGMTVFLDFKGLTVTAVSPWLPQAGQEAIFLRALPDSNCIEVKHLDQPMVLYATQPLLDGVREGRVKRNDRIIFCLQRRFAFGAVPAEQDRRYRFIDKTKIPEIVAARDIGRPHWILGWMLKRLRIMLHHPELMEQFDFRPRCSAFLSGPSGTGKTLTIGAFLYESHRMMAEFVGRDDVGSRVIRVKSSDLLSHLFGVTDQNIDALFDDILALARETIEVDGRRVTLPIVVIMEEAEALAKRRGDFDGAIYDRVIGMLLQRLDDPTDSLANVPLFWITTSNRAEIMDSAMWRRLAGVRAEFLRLDRDGALAVLHKKLKPKFPYASHNGTPHAERRTQAIDRVMASLFSPNGDDAGQLELTLRDGQKLTKHRRDFLTGAVIERAVSLAIESTAGAAVENGGQTDGLSAERLIEALRHVIDGELANVTPHNAGDYLDLPEHTPVASVRRLRQERRQWARLAR
jgi:hypothetical protein